ncbi:hypothetical protein [Roseicella aquatilis]|uniref:Uncharacterized protein n=1 Tax=Roseicella aquatilis TaxID=2527868 RepID=A0A4R4D3P9_9PROT|nr:hypothetical protein [Roseicella aquatilis]TCZ51562.1 hypothetical protein EXY23_26805 [Roseicella aquatilis]
MPSRAPRAASPARAPEPLPAAQAGGHDRPQGSPLRRPATRPDAVMPCFQGLAALAGLVHAIARSGRAALPASCHRGWRPLAAALALSACAAPAPVARAPQDLAARLPETAAGFQRGATLPLPQRPGGQEVAYATRGRIAAGAIIEIHPPAEPVPDGAASPAIAAALAELLAEAQRAPGHRQQRETGRLTLPEAGPPGLACAETTGLYGRERVQGLLCAGALEGRVLRLRVTMPRREPPPADPRAFATAILRALRGA